MSLKQFFFPVKIKDFQDSKYNSQIELVKFSGSLRLDMGGLTQSGEIIERIWNTGFKRLLPHRYTPSSVLILGFGSGSAARLISRRWPKAQITGVEIDPQVIDIARQYFHIDRIPDLTLINQDASKFVRQSKQHFDLTIIDCYQGHQIPPSLQTPDFFHTLSHLSDHILINRIFWGEYKQQAADFITTLEPYYTYTTCRTPSNLLISITPKQ